MTDMHEAEIADRDAAIDRLCMELRAMRQDDGAVISGLQNRIAELQKENIRLLDFVHQWSTLAMRARPSITSEVWLHDCDTLRNLTKAEIK